MASIVEATPVPIPTITPKPIISNINYFFRKVNFGMSKEEITNSEGMKPDLDIGNYFAYYTKINNIDSKITYVINGNNNLCGIMIIPLVEHTNDNNYILDYDNFNTMLINKYGEPTMNKTSVWKRDLYKNDTQQYGFAISLGDLSYLTTWDKNDYIINNTIYGDNFKIKSAIVFRSKIYPQPPIENGI